MFQESLDLEGNDHVWRNKPELPAPNEENRKLEETLRQKKIEIERLKLILENNRNKGKNMREHLNNLRQTLSYKQQLYKSKEHELEREMHSQKLIEREKSRLEQEMKMLHQELKLLAERQSNRQKMMAEQAAKCEKLRSAVRWDEDTLLSYLEKSAQMERDNMALLKYASEDDSKINELGLCIERLSKEVHDRKSALDDADTEVFIVQSELDKMQEEFRNAYNERNNLISNWEKVINQIQQRNSDIQKQSEHIDKMRDEKKKMKQEEKEQLQLLASETERNNALENEIKQKDKMASKLHSDIKSALIREENLRAELSTKKNVSSYLLYQKQAAENSLAQLEKQLEQKNQKIEDVKETNEKIENDIEILNKETFEADHYIKQLENLLQKENKRSIEIQKEVANLTKETLTYSQQLKELKFEEKFLTNQIKNCQADIRNLNSTIAAVDNLRAKQESEMYEVESKYENLLKRVKKMSGVTNENEKRQIEAEKARLLSILEDKKRSLTMLTEELKIMRDKITVSTRGLETNEKLNTELEEKIKSIEFQITNCQKALKHSISKKQELLVQECFLKFHMKRYRKLLSNRNKSVFSLQKYKAEFEAMMKERTEELKNCIALQEAEIRSEEEECCLVKKKLLESDSKLEKLKCRYKMIMDSLGVSEPGASAETELLIKAEEEKRDLQYERDQLMSNVLKENEDLTALKNTLWMINIANEQFRQVVYPAGISLEHSEALRNTEEESQAVGIKLHICKNELKAVNRSIETKKEKINQVQCARDELQGVINEWETKNKAMAKEIENIETKIARADRCNSSLSLDLRKKDSYTGIEEDIRIHLLREVRRTASDLLFSAVEAKPAIKSKLEQLFEDAKIPLPARTRSSISSRSSSASNLFSRSSSSKPPSLKSRSSSNNSTPSSSRASSRAVSPSVVMLGTPPSDSNKKEST